MMGVVVGLLFAPISVFVFLYEGRAHGNWFPVTSIVAYVLMHGRVETMIPVLSLNPQREKFL